MPFVKVSPDSISWKRRCRRVIISGPPNSGKTHSVYTCPGKVAYLSYPGELGSSTIDIARLQAAGGQAWIWEQPVDGTPMDWGAIRKAIVTLTIDILAGKYGVFDSFFGDGLHKLYGVFLADKTVGASERGDDFEPREYGTATTAFFNYIRGVFQSPIEHAFFTVWEGREKDNPEDTGSHASTHIYPELPGKAAKQIMGESSVVVATTVRQTVEGGKTVTRYLAQTRPHGKIWGAGIKAPVEVVQRIPLFVPQDWTALINLLDPPAPAAEGAQ